MSAMTNPTAFCQLTDEQGIVHTVVGNISGAYAGQELTVSGIWEKHPEFGQQFRIQEYQFNLPATTEGIKRYLASGLIHGIGKKIAGQIVDHFGLKTLEVMDNYSERLTEINGIGKKRVAEIRKAWQSQASRRELYIFLQSLGLSPAYCNRIYNRYGDTTASIIKNNPFQLADEVDGIGFIMADKIAANSGMNLDSSNRLIAGLKYILNLQVNNGHTCYPEKILISEAAEILKVDTQKIEKGILSAIEQNILVKETFDNTTFIYLTKLAAAETELPQLIHRLNQPHHEGLKIQQKSNNTNFFSDEQLQAVKNSCAYPLSIISGGPGVGKTTVVSEIVNRAKNAKLSICLAAPTGRAAKRLSQSANIKASTIHRLLKWEPAKQNFIHGLNNPINYQMIIVDEVSMLDINLAICLFRAIKPGSTVVLVGDADQLPSVGPGEVLRDLMKSNFFKVTMLTKIFRQSSGSNIIINAHRVNEGIIPQKLNIPKEHLTDFYWIKQENNELIPEQIIKIVKNRIPKRFRFHPIKEVQILTPANRGITGTIALNQLLQNELNSGHKPQFKIGERVFKANDKVMQINNNYDKKIFNGDMGYISTIDQKNKTFTVIFEDKPINYNFDEADQISLAYAITVHKSQGSEFKAVIMIMTTQNYMMLQKNLLYTGMTRAKKLLILIASPKAVTMAVNNKVRTPRYTNLQSKLAAYNS